MYCGAMHYNTVYCITERHLLYNEFCNTINLNTLQTLQINIIYNHITLH